MDKVLQMIGMAKRAGKVVTGNFLCEKAIKAKDSKLIVIAKDISEESKKTLTDACKYYDIKYIEYGDKDRLGNITGGGDRVCVSVNDAGFARAVLDKYSHVE